MPVFKRWHPTGAFSGYEIKMADRLETPVTRRVLVLIDEPEGDERRVLADGAHDPDEDRLTTYENVVAWAVKTENQRPASFSILLAAPDPAGQASSLKYEIVKLLKHYRPHTVLCAGFRVAKAILGPNYSEHYGRLTPIDLEGDNLAGETIYARVNALYTVPVYGWTNPYPQLKGDDSGGFVNLIGQFIEHLQTGLRGSNRGTIYVPQPRHLEIEVIDTIPKFDAFYDHLLSTRRLSFDTETENLNRLANRILTMHWLFPDPHDPDDFYHLYCLPWLHREAGWLPDEIEYMTTKLRRYCESARSEYWIGHNLKFDITQLINGLKLRWFNHRVFDTQSGAFLLDESRKFLTQIGVLPYALTTLEREHGYTRPPEMLDKESRSNMAAQPLSLIAPYGSVDVITPWLIHRQQMAEAERRGYANYFKVVVDQLSMTIHGMAGMEARGMPADAAYLQSLVMPESEINQQLEIRINRFQNSEACQRINDALLAERQWQPEGMFGTNAKPWLFDLSKREHLERLFFNELGLEPLSRGSSGVAKLDNGFQQAYKHVPEVSWLTDYNKMYRLKTGFADNLHVRMMKEPDAIRDGCIRPTLDYKYVLTGRSSSRDPNSQNQPSRGKLAKIIKRIWIAPPGELLIDGDFGAHEMRGLGNISHDPTIAAAFAAADAATINLRVASVADLAAALDRFQREGDFHIQNVRFFYSLEVDKKHPLRTAIKVVAFGVVYGKGAPSLAVELRQGVKDSLDDMNKAIAEMHEKLKALGGVPVERDALRTKLVKTTNERNEAQARYERSDSEWTNEAKELINKLFTKWDRAGNWIHNTHDAGFNQLVIFNQIGAPRHLYPYLHMSKRVQAAMDRRGPNTMIQGFSSQTGYAAGYLIEREVWQTFTRHNLNLGFKQINSVHDSLKNRVRFAMLPIASYLIEHGMISQVKEHYARVYNLELPINFGVGIEYGIDQSNMTEWFDQRYDSMVKHLRTMYDQTRERQAANAANLEPHQLVTEQTLSDALHNVEAIARVRTAELQRDPLHMSLKGKTGWYAQNIRGLAQAA